MPSGRTSTTITGSLTDVHDPDLMPELVQAEVAIESRSLTAAQIRGLLHLTLETAAGRTGPALVAVPGVDR